MAEYVPRNELSCALCDGQAVPPSTECRACALGLLPAPCDGCEQLLHGVVLRPGDRTPLCLTCRSRCDRCNVVQPSPNDLSPSDLLVVAEPNDHYYCCANCIDELEWGYKCDGCGEREHLVGGSAQVVGDAVILRNYCAPCYQRISPLVYKRAEEEEGKEPYPPATTTSPSSQPS